MQAYKSWPNGKKVAVTISVMYETWSEGTAPTYSVHASTLKPGTVDHAGHAWSTFGARSGIWRILHALNRWGVPATVFPNARCAELYPDSIKEAVRAGHHIGAHAYTQDGLLTYMSADEQRMTIRKARSLLGDVCGKPPNGWISPVLAFTPDTHALLVEEGFEWHGDVTYMDMPHRVQTSSGVIAAVPLTDFSDNRVLRSSPRDVYDVHIGTLNYLLGHEPMGVMGILLHCHFGGRPMMMAVFDEVIREMQKSENVWFATHDELAQWALAQPQDEVTFKDRFFAGV